MRCKNIAVLMTAVDSDAQADILRGIEEYGKAHGCNIAAFIWSTGAFEREKHNLGEVHIVNLPDLNLFDGVIVVGNALHIDYNRRLIEEKLDNLTCPVVCVGCKIKNHHSVQTDTYTAMRKIAEHFVLEHKVKDIHFVKGVEGSIEAEARYKAFEDVMNENGIPILPERVSQGDFYVTGAEKAAEEIMNCVLPFPKAIICANDITAITICDILMENGYRVPEDVMISGYDYSVEAQSHTPHITTVRMNVRGMGFSACEMLLDMVQGKEVPEDLFLPDELVLDESCGCHKSKKDSEMASDKLKHSEEIAKRKMIHQLISLEKNYTECECIGDWFYAVRKFVSKVDDVSEFYCCVNEGFTDKYFEMDAMEQEEMTLAQKLSYTKRVYPVISYKDGLFLNKKGFESKYALDDLFKETDRCKLYVFSPLHYLDRTFGYVVFADSEFTIANQLFISWLIGMGSSIENIRKQSMLQNAMKRLEDMYVRDSLTGVYNRFGLARSFAEIKQKSMMSRIKMQISFVDLDDLKGINDQYGHEMGDEIISSAASIMHDEAGKCVVARYGGDEFIVIGTARDIHEPEEYWKRVERRIAEYNRKSGRDLLSLSYGYEIFNVESKTTLEECILSVDARMYEKKRQKKEAKKNQ